MTNPFGSFDPSGDVSARMRGYLEESSQYGRDVLRKWRALDGLEYGPVGPSTPDMFGAKPAKINAQAESLMVLNPRDGSDFGLFEGPGTLMKQFGQIRNADEDPQVVLPVRDTAPETAIAPPDSRPWYEIAGDAIVEAAPKLGRTVRSIATAGLDQFDPRADAEENAARKLARREGIAGVLTTLVDQANTAVQAGRLAMNPAATLGELSGKYAIAEVTSTPADRDQKRQEAMRYEMAQAAINTIDTFRRNAQLAAIEEGVSTERRDEANTWAFNGGKLVGMLPLGGYAEQALAMQLKGMTSGLSAGSIMASSILRHGAASAGANILLTPLGTPLLPDVDPKAETAVQIGQAFMDPSYAQSAVLGFALGAGGAWFADKVMKAFGVGKYAKSVDDVYSGDVYTNFRDPQLGTGPLAPEEIPYADFELFNDAPVGAGTQIRGALEAGPAPRGPAQPTPATPPQGPFNAPSTTPVSGPLGDLNAPAQARALLNPGEAMVRPGELDVLLQTIDDVQIIDPLNAAIVNAQRTQLQQMAIEGVLPQTSALEQVYQLANDVDLRAKFLAAADEADYAPSSYRGAPMKDDVFLLEQAVAQLFGDTSVNYMRRSLAGLSREKGFDQLARLYDFVKREVDLRNLGVTSVQRVSETVEGVAGPPLVKSPRVIDPFEGPVGTAVPEPIETQIPQIETLLTPAPTTNAPVIVSGSAAAAGQALAQAQGSTQVFAPEATVLAGPASGSNQPVSGYPFPTVQVQPLNLDQLAPLQVAEIQTPQMQAETAGMDTETAQLISEPREATVDASRTNLKGVSGEEIASRFDTDLRGRDGKPRLFYGSGDVTQVMEFGENGSLSLMAGRTSVVYLTADPYEAGGDPGQNYFNEEIAGGQFPVATQAGQQSPLVTNAATMKKAGLAQIDQAILYQKQLLRSLDPLSNMGEEVRGRINQMERLRSKQRRPVSAVTPFYAVPRQTVQLNEGIQAELFESMPDERTPTEEAFLNVLLYAPQMFPKLAERTVERKIKNADGTTSYEQVPAIKAITDNLQDGKYSGELGARALYNHLGFWFGGESMATKGNVVNHMLKMQGFDAMIFRTEQGVSRGNSQISREGVENLIVLDPRILVPAYSADTEIEQGLERLHATRQTMAEAVASKPARPDLPRIRKLGALDYIDTKLIVDLDEHVMIKYPEDAQELIGQVKRQYPGYYVQAVQGPTLSNQPEVYVGVRPFTQEMVDAYKQTGYYPNQGVKDMKMQGQPRRVYAVEHGEPGKPVKVTLYPEVSGGNFQGAITVNGKDGKPSAGRDRLVPSNGTAPIVNAPEQWEAFKEFAASYMAQLNAQGKTEIESLFDPDARQVMAGIMTSYFDATGVSSAVGREGIRAYFDLKLGQEYAKLSPEAGDFYTQMRDTAFDAMDNDLPPTLDDLASARGMYMMRAPGGTQIVLRSNRTAEVQIFSNDDAARAFLESYEPVEMDVEVEGTIPSIIGANGNVESTPMGRQGDPKGRDPYDQSTSRKQTATDDSFETVFPASAAVSRAYGTPTDIVPTQPPVGGGNGRFGTGIFEPSNYMLKMEKLNNALGWLKPNHAFMAELEQALQDAGFTNLRPYADIQLLKEKQSVALERGNTVYKQLEVIRRSVDRRTMNDGTVWNVLKQPTQAARINYLMNNPSIPAEVLNTVAALDKALDDMFGSGAARKAMWNNLVQYIENLGNGQRLNRQARTPTQFDLYDTQAAGLSNIEWFVAHAKNIDLIAETVNAIDMIGSMTHSLNFHRYVAKEALRVKRTWAQIGRVEFPTAAGSRVKVLAPFANEVTNWIELLQTGRIHGTVDPLVKLVKEISTILRMPLTQGEVKTLIGQGLGNTTRSFMGWTLMPILRDFMQFTFTLPFTGPQSMAKAVKDFSGTNSAFHFARLKRLGLASTENDLQAARGLIDERRGDAEIVSPFSPEQIAQRERMHARTERIANAIPNWMRNAQDVGMSLYLKGNSLSRRLSAQSAINAFEAAMNKRGNMNAAAMVNAGGSWFDDLLDELSVAQKPTRKLMQDRLAAGDVEGAMTTYARYVVDVSQGVYGPLHSGKLWRTVTGRTAGVFQNFTMSMYNYMKQAAGWGANGGIKSPIAKAKLGGGALLLLGGADWLAHRIREEHGVDLTMYAPGHMFHSTVPVPALSILTSPVVDATLGSFDQVNAFTSQFGDYQQRNPGGRTLMDLAGNMAAPFARPLTNTVNFGRDIMDSNMPGMDALNFLLTNKSMPNGMETFQKYQEQNDVLQSLLDRQSSGGGAQ